MKNRAWKHSGNVYSVKRFLIRRLSTCGLSKPVVSLNQRKTLRWFRVEIGPFETEESYKKAREHLERLGLRLIR